MARAKKDYLRGIAERIVERARRGGARQAEAYLEVQRESSVRVRDGEVEELTQATSRGVGLRVIVARRLGFAYSSDLTSASLDLLVERALALAHAAAADEHNRLPDARALAGRHAALGLLDPALEELSVEWKIEAARTMERVGRGLDRRIASFESVGAADVVSEVAIASSEGFSDSYRSSFVALHSAPVACDDAGGLQTGYWMDCRRFLSELAPAEAIGRRAAQRTLRLLGARKGPTCRVPVVLEPAQAAELLGSLAGALSGSLVQKRASFLCGKLGETVASPELSLEDNGLLPHGLASRPFDGEGLPTRRTLLIERGRLQRYLYDTYAAHKAREAKPQGSKPEASATASRNYQSLPAIGTTNLVAVAHRPVPAAEIVCGVKRGLYVTAMLGRGADTVTGDYSRGANGIWIENGELTYPVQEVTVAGNLLEMLQSIDAVGDDLESHGSVHAPTIRFAELTVAGG